jgi:hypothetical protein
MKVDIGRVIARIDDEATDLETVVLIDAILDDCTLADVILDEW